MVVFSGIGSQAPTLGPGASEPQEHKPTGWDLPESRSPYWPTTELSSTNLWERKARTMKANEDSQTQGGGCVGRGVSRSQAG